MQPLGFLPSFANFSFSYILTLAKFIYAASLHLEKNYTMH